MNWPLFIQTARQTVPAHLPHSVHQLRLHMNQRHCAVWGTDSCRGWCYQLLPSLVQFLLCRYLSRCLCECWCDAGDSVMFVMVIVWCLWGVGDVWCLWGVGDIVMLVIVWCLWGVGDSVMFMMCWWCVMFMRCWWCVMFMRCWWCVGDSVMCWRGIVENGDNWWISTCI